MNIILVCLNNFQEYILTNIEQLIKLNIKNIYVITNKDFFKYFFNLKDKINLIESESIIDSYNFYNNTSLNKDFRNGFWTLTSQRLFYIYEVMKNYNLENVIHIENDVLLYYNIDNIINKVNNNYVYIPFDSFRRNIASIVYIPNHYIWKNILDNYNFHKNDMENFLQIKNKTNLIEHFPIFHSEYAITDEEKFVSQNYNLFHFIFDAAAIGQYIGGVDPRNNAGDTTGFINETCIIKYNNYKIIWINIDKMNKPFLKINDKDIIPIYNLHIHSKNLIKFI
jgi:hypothetical protein